MKTMDKIKTLRIKKGYSQEELGKIIGVQKAAINKYETGRVVNIKRSTLQKLATALDVKPIELFDDEEIVSVSKSDIKSTKSVMIPILNEIVAGMPIDAKFVSPESQTKMYTSPRPKDMFIADFKVCLQ